MKKIDAFWDASALVPLCVAQGTSSLARTAARTKSIAVWWVSPVEMTSAFMRLLRSQEIDQTNFLLAMARLTELRRRWIEVQPTEVVRELAQTLLERHALRAADAMQLAAALIWSKQRARGRSFVCMDSRLSEAAGKEGFSVQSV